MSNDVLQQAISDGDVTAVRMAIPADGLPERLRPNVWSPLMLAADGGHLEVVHLLLNAGAEPNVRNRYGWTALLRASEKGHSEVARVLIDAGADVRVREHSSSISPANRNPLEWSISHGDGELLRVLLNAGADPDESVGKPGPPVFHAIEAERFDLLEVLLDAGADINAAGGSGIRRETLLTWAAREGTTDLVRTLLDRGADFNRTDSDGWSPLMWAANCNRLESLDLLLEAGADGSLRNRCSPGVYTHPSNYNLTALELATQRGHATVVERLLAPGELEQQGLGTALLWASMNGTTEITRQLQAAGGDLDPAAEAAGWTPLMTAAVTGNASHLKELLDVNADVNAVTDRSATALHLACAHGQPESVRLLLKAGADPSVKDEFFRTPFWMAMERSHVSVVSVLLEAGVDTEERDRWEVSPVMRAVQQGQVKLVRLLLTSGECPADRFGHAFEEAVSDGNCDIVRTLGEFTPAAIKDACLLKAAEDGSPELVQTLVSVGASVAARDRAGATPLIIAASHWRVRPEVVRVLLEAGSEVNTRGRDDVTALMKAACVPRSGDVLSALLCSGADPDLRNRQGRSALDRAAEQYWWSHDETLRWSHDETLRAEIEQILGPHEPRPPHRRWIPFDARQTLKRKWRNRTRQFLRAAATDDLASLQQLAAQRVHPDVQLRRGWTALHAAAEAGHAGIIRFLLSCGAGLDIQDDASGATPLHLAATGGHVEAIRELLAHWAETEVFDRFDCTPLTASAAAGQVAAARLLLEHGALVDAGNDIVTPLMAAARYGQVAMIDLLLDHGADIDRYDLKESYTALMLAAQFGQAAAVRRLAARGADVNRMTEWFETPLSLACREGQSEIVVLLRELGATERVD